jgi:8-oxo-dGTP pyrophosphatase MutT (NUDIX family)
MANETNPWTTLGTVRRYEDSFVAVDDNRVVDAAGHESQYGVVRFKHVGVRILPIDEEGSTFLVGQFRYGASYFSWELPAGSLEPGEDVEAGARRELREEVGRLAARWFDLAELVPSGSVTDERGRLLVAWDLTRAEQDLDEQEVIRVKRLPFTEAVAMALGGAIKDAGTIVALLSAQARAQSGDLPPALLPLLAPRR